MNTVTAVQRRMITSLRREVDENSAHLGCDTANGGNFLPMFRDDLSVPSSGVESPKAFGFLAPEDGTDRLSRNVGKKLPPLAA